MYKTIIVDDDEQSRVILKEELHNHCPNIHIVGEADGVETAVESILMYDPHIVFLDIQLSKGTGFTILQKLETVNFHIIFVTAYDQFALKALKANAADYLLKPINKKELIEAVRKVETLISKNLVQLKIEDLINSNLAGPNTKSKKIALNTAEGIHLYTADEIIRCVSEGNYTTFFIKNGERLLIAKNLKQAERLLVGYNFKRVHQSYIINIDHIKKYINKDGGELLLSDGSLVPVSQRKKTEVLLLLK